MHPNQLLQGTVGARASVLISFLLFVLAKGQLIMLEKHCFINAFFFQKGHLEAGHTEAKSRDSASDDARFQGNLRIRRCKIAKNRSMPHRPANCDFHRLILHQAILVLFSKECVPATHDSVHRCLALRIPVLTAVLFRRIR